MGSKVGATVDLRFRGLLRVAIEIAVPVSRDLFLNSGTDLSAQTSGLPSIYHETHRSPWRLRSLFPYVEISCLFLGTTESELAAFRKKISRDLKKTWKRSSNGVRQISSHGRSTAVCKRRLVRQLCRSRRDLEKTWKRSSNGVRQISSHGRWTVVR